jgi:aminoglycoside phosphotransferase (APT) family kinase protein
LTSRQAENSGTGAVRAGLEIDEARLADWLCSRVEGFRGPLRVRQFRGGQSNPTYLLETATKRYVLRRKPPGPLLSSAHAVDREFRIISALHAAGFPVPQPFAFCSDEAVTGTTFFVMAYVEGRIFWELDLPGLHPDERAAIYDDVNRTIARLHTIDYEALGLGDFGRPGNYFARQVSRWTKQYRASELHRIEAMERLIEWLPGNIPADDSTSIVHGDFRLDNLIVHPDEPRVIAVLDWELSTLGHPLADAAFSCLAWHSRPEWYGGIMGLDLDALGIPTQEEYLQHYYRAAGRSTGVEVFHLVFSLFRFAVILEGIAGRAKAGNAAAENAAQVGNLSVAYARRAAELIETQG